MADSTIDNLPAAGSSNNTDVYVISQSGVTKKTTKLNILESITSDYQAADTTIASNLATEITNRTDGDNLRVLKAGDTMTGSLTMSGGSTQVILPNAPSTGTHSTNKTYCDLKVIKAGDTMSGTLDMGTNKITSTYVPVSNPDLTNKLYVDSKLSKSGGTVTGTIDLGGNKITTTYTPTNGPDLTNKTYVDSKTTPPGFRARINPTPNINKSALIGPLNGQTITSYNDISFDDLSVFDATSGVWTCPETAYYDMNIAISLRLSGDSQTQFSSGSIHAILATTGTIYTYASYTNSNRIYTGNGTLTAGTGIVVDSRITATSKIFAIHTSGGANTDTLYVNSPVAGVGFTINSTNSSDSSTFIYHVIDDQALSGDIILTATTLNAQVSLGSQISLKILNNTNSNYVGMSGDAIIISIRKSRN